MADTAKWDGCIAHAIALVGSSHCRCLANLPYPPRRRVVATAGSKTCAIMVGMGNMAADQRREAIKRVLAEDPAVSQQALAVALGVSQKTVSRDLEQLKRGPDLVMTNSSRRGRPRGTVVKLHVNGGSSPGEDLVAKIRAEMDAKDLEPDAREEGLLLQIRQVADEVAGLRELT